MVQQLSRQDVEAAFREMGELLVRAGNVAEIAVFGGAAIMLQFAVNFHTGMLMHASRPVTTVQSWPPLPRWRVGMVGCAHGAVRR